MRGMTARTVSSAFRRRISARVRSNSSAVISPASTKAGPASATDSSRNRLSSPRARTGWLKATSGAGNPAAWTFLEVILEAGQADVPHRHAGPAFRSLPPWSK